MASVSKRGNKYCVRYRYETETGEIREKRVSGFSSKEDAWAAARDLEMKSSSGIDVHGDTMTCAEVMERWFADHCAHLSENTRAKYSAAIDKLSGFSLPICRSAALIPAVLICFCLSSRKPYPSGPLFLILNPSALLCPGLSLKG